MIIARFGDLSEFLTELKERAGAGHLSTDTVRCSQEILPTKLAQIAHLHFVATFTFVESGRERLVSLRLHAGQVLRTGREEDVNEAAFNRGQEWLAAVKAEVAALGLVVRPGILTASDEVKE